jgi:hypothetical protein
VIGLVKEKNENGNNFIISLEDTTGDVKAVVSKDLGEKLALDDVIALSGNINNKILFADKLIYPDVPIRQVNYSKVPIKIAFLEEGKGCDADYIFHRDEVVDKIKDRNYAIANPYLSEIDDILILTIFGFNPLEVLRKRYVSIENTDFLINSVPDIIFTDKDVNTNYKGPSFLFSMINHVLFDFVPVSLCCNLTLKKSITIQAR